MPQSRRPTTTKKRSTTTRTRASDQKPHRRILDTTAKFLKNLDTRDVWLFIISGILLWSTLIGQQTANKANQTSKATLALIHAVQQQRIDSVWGGCDTQNKKHDNTIGKLNAEIKYFQKHPLPGQAHLTKAALKQEIRANINIINAILPDRDCDKAVEIAVGTKTYRLLILHINKHHKQIHAPTLPANVQLPN